MIFAIFFVDLFGRLACFVIIQNSINGLYTFWDTYRLIDLVVVCYTWG